MSRPFALPVCLALIALTGGCSRARTYELRGQIVAVDATREELTITHEDIRGFMPGMTMPFKVRPGAAVKEREPGELVRATLVVEDASAYLTDVRVEGRAPLPEGTVAPRSDLLEIGEAVPDAAFIDHSGVVRRLSDWRSRTVAVTFTYTRCPIPDFCPLMDRQFAAVQREVQGDPGLRGRVQLLSISIDPVFDTPPVLAEHAARAGADPDVWRFLTGDAAEIREFAARFGVAATREDPASPDLLHNLRTAVIDRHGRIAVIFTGNTWKPAELSGALRDADRAR
jgi:protein SCO1/2